MVSLLMYKWAFFHLTVHRSDVSDQKGKKHGSHSGKQGISKGRRHRRGAGEVTRSDHQGHRGVANRGVEHHRLALGRPGAAQTPAGQGAGGKEGGDADGRLDPEDGQGLVFRGEDQDANRQEQDIVDYF